MIVFVLSKTNTLTSFNCSIASLLLTKIPCLANTLLPTSKEIGVAKPKAHGQLTTITLTAKLKAWLKSWLLGILIHKTKVNIAREIITGTKYLAIISIFLVNLLFILLASITNEIILDKTLSFFALLILIFNVPSIFKLPPITWSSSSL